MYMAPMGICMRGWTGELPCGKMVDTSVNRDFRWCIWPFYWFRWMFRTFFEFQELLESIWWFLFVYENYEGFSSYATAISSILRQCIFRQIHKSHGKSLYLSLCIQKENIFFSLTLFSPTSSCIFIRFSFSFSVLPAFPLSHLFPCGLNLKKIIRLQTGPPRCYFLLALK